MTESGPRSPANIATLIFISLFVIYNANGREIGSYDSQPAKFLAREIARHGSLSLDREIAAMPGLAERSAFQKDLHGHYRSGYSIVPAVLAAVPAWFLRQLQIVDLDAPLAPALIAKLTASILVAAAVALVFLAVARMSSVPAGLLVAVALGVGTNLWALASQTLWAHETVTFGLAVALSAWWRPTTALRNQHLWWGAIGVALAGSARPQVSPIVFVLVCSLISRVGWKRALLPAIGIATLAASVMLVEWSWFGSVFGATPQIEALHESVHGTGTFSLTPWMAAAGLLVSPSRGVLVFSPVVIVALIGIPGTWRAGSATGARWFLTASALQFVGYSCYAVWWAGHTFGPRYMLDTLIPLVPAAAAGVQWATLARWRRLASVTVLAWAVTVAATGAFCYPNDQWNSDPDDVDLHHERLWDWTDSQIVRCWQRGWSPQNFGLVDRSAWRPDRRAPQ